MLWIDHLGIELKDYIATFYLSMAYLTDLEETCESKGIIVNFKPRRYEHFQILSGKPKKVEESREMSALFFVEELKKLGLWDEKVSWEGT